MSSFDMFAKRPKVNNVNSTLALQLSAAKLVLNNRINTDNERVNGTFALARRLATMVMQHDRNAGRGTKLDRNDLLLAAAAVRGDRLMTDNERVNRAFITGRLLADTVVMLHDHFAAGGKLPKEWKKRRKKIDNTSKVA